MAFLLLLTTMAALGQQGNIEGRLYYHDNWPVGGATVVLVNQVSGTAVATTVTDSTGLYFFSGLYPGVYTLQISVQADEGGIDLADAALIMDYLNPNSQIVLSPIQLMAADMNKDGLVTQADKVAIVQFWAHNHSNAGGNGNGNGNNNHGAIATVEEEWVFLNTQILDTFIVTTDTSESDTTYYESEGSKRGDVDGAFEPQKKPGDVQYLSAEGYLSAQPGDLVRIPFKAIGMNDIRGFGLRIGYDASRLSAKGIEGLPEGAVFSIAEGYIQLAWMSVDDLPRSYTDGEVVFDILFTVRAASKGEIDPLTSLHGSHFIGSGGTKEMYASLSYPALMVSEDLGLVGQSYPNPANNHSRIGLQLLSDAEVGYCIMDLTGRVLLTAPSTTLTAGAHELSLDLASLPAGHYVAHLLLKGKSGEEMHISRQVSVAGH